MAVLRRNREFQTVRSEGGLLPSDLLRRVIDPKAKLDGTRPEDYGLPQSERLNEVITQSWSRLRKHWGEFRGAATGLTEAEAGTALTNDKWSLPLLRELGFGLLPTSAGPEVGGRTYAISRFFGPVPIHLVGCGLSLDRRTAGVRGAAAVNPHGLVQEFVNRSPGYLWALVSNGLRLRVLRDSQALSRQSFLEFDLETMFTGEIFSDFVLLWLVTHATRFAPREGERPESCWLEEWTKLADEQGTRALGDLRGGVERALQILGEGLTSHPRNASLREALRKGQVSPADFHGQLLRVVYRLIFLFVAEDRTLDGQALLHPRDDSDAGLTARDRYAAHYGTGRLRELASKIKGSRHGDLWRQFQLLVGALSGNDDSEAIRQVLALPALGSFLWSPNSTTALNDAELTNYDFLEALRHLAFTRDGKVLRPVDYKNLGAEELGGVYESLLALTPQISASGAHFSFAELAGNERKTSGSYYTPDSLVQCLLDSALDPVVEGAIRGKSGTEAERAILALKICDPAVGSGHFLVGAAHRMARHLSRVRALAQGESEPSPLLYQHALRDVIGRCLYGVDLNPMAAELCRVSLWLEAMEPDRPLSFLDHHIRVGNSLLGATPTLIAAGLPDDAFTAMEGDDKKACAVLRKRNKVERKGLGPLFAQQDAETEARLQQAAAGLEALPDDRPEDIRAKELAFRRHEEAAEYLYKKRIADAWCAAFTIEKRFGEPGREASARGITQGHLNDLANGRPLPADIDAETSRLSSQHQFFHWHLAFPEVFAKGGFNCVLANPPWERTSFEEIQFFAARDHSAIASAPTTAIRRDLIAQLKVDRDPRYTEYVRERRANDAEQHLLTASGRFPLTAVARSDTYALFTELATTLTRPEGQLGLIVPTGIATSIPLQKFWRFLFGAKRVRRLSDFENRSRFFSGVDSRKKFCLLTAGGTGSTYTATQFGFFIPEATTLAIQDCSFPIDPAVLERVNPLTCQPPVVPSIHDLLLLVHIHRHSGNNFKENPGWVGYTSAGTGDTWVSIQEIPAVSPTGSTPLVPLIEGKMINQFDHRFATYAGASRDAIDKGQPERVAERHADPSFLSHPRFYVPRDAANTFRTHKTQYSQVAPVYRDYTSATNERTLIAALIPNGVPMQPLNGFSCSSAIDALNALARFNSLIVDYIARLKTPDIHLNVTIFNQLPGQPLAISRAEYRGWADSLIARALELVFTAWDLEPFARDCGWSGPPFRWDEERRFLIRCEMDASLFHLYLPAETSGAWCPAEGETSEDLARLKEAFPTPRDAVAFIMDSFLIVRDKDQARYDGDYRTKSVVLAIYDAMQESIRTGQPYRTRIDPPPGPPVDANGNFVDYLDIADNPPPHIHLPRGCAETGNSELQLSDLGSSFPQTPFMVRLGTAPEAALVRVTPVPTADVRAADRVLVASPALRLRGAAAPAVIGTIGIESRTDASSGVTYILISVRSESGVAQARFSPEEWQSLSTIGVVQDIG